MESMCFRYCYVLITVIVAPGFATVAIVFFTSNYQCCGWWKLFSVSHYSDGLSPKITGNSIVLFNTKSSIFLVLCEKKAIVNSPHKGTEMCKSFLYRWVSRKDVTPLLMHWSYVFLALTIDIMTSSWLGLVKNIIHKNRAGIPNSLSH